MDKLLPEASVFHQSSQRPGRPLRAGQHRHALVLKPRYKRILPGQKRKAQHRLVVGSHQSGHGRALVFNDLFTWASISASGTPRLARARYHGRRGQKIDQHAVRPLVFQKDLGDGMEKIQRVLGIGQVHGIVHTAGVGDIRPEFFQGRRRQGRQFDTGPPACIGSGRAGSAGMGLDHGAVSLWQGTGTQRIAKIEHLFHGPRPDDAALFKHPVIEPVRSGKRPGVGKTGFFPGFRSPHIKGHNGLG
jgi:hypothetical protein